MANEPGGLMLGGVAYHLPAGARTVAAPGIVRPLPGGPPGLDGLAMIEGRATAIWRLAPAPTAWVLVQTDAGPALLGGDGIVASPPPGAPCLVPPRIRSHGVAVQAVERAARPTMAAGGRSAATPPVPPPMLTLRHGHLAVRIALGAVEELRPVPESVSAVPGGATGVAGYAATPDGPVLLLDLAWWAGEAGASLAAAPICMAVFRQGRSRLGMGCARAEPGGDGIDLAARLTGSVAGRRALDLAPSAATDQAPTLAMALLTAPTIEPSTGAVPSAGGPRAAFRSLLVCRAGPDLFALLAEDVAALIAPQALPPVPAGAAIRGVCAHRGAVLPVLDAGECLGQARTAMAAGPWVRLVLAQPVALAVSEVLGLRRVPEHAIAPVPGDRLVAALASLLERTDIGPVPICRAAAMTGRTA